MLKHKNFKEVIKKGVDNFVSILKDVDLYDEVAERIKRKTNNFDPIIFLNQSFEKKSNFLETIFSDLNYSLDFYEGFNVSDIIDLSFPDKNLNYQIITDFYDRVTQKIIHSITLNSNGVSDYCESDFSSSVMNSSDRKWRIVINLENETYEFRWVDFGEDNIMNFLNCINDSYRRSNSHFKWFPINCSSHYSSFIFTTEKRYNSIIGLNLMQDLVYHSPNGVRITAANRYIKEILPTSNISCEVQMAKEGLPIFVKLWRKSKEGSLKINFVPQMILEKLELLSKLGNQLNFTYGDILIDTNNVLSNKEFADINDTFSRELEEALSNKSIDLKNNVINVFRNEPNNFIRSFEVKTNDNI